MVVSFRRHFSKRSEQLTREKLSHSLIHQHFSGGSGTCAICVEHLQRNLSATAIQIRGTIKVTLKGISGHREDVRQRGGKQ